MPTWRILVYYEMSDVVSVEAASLREAIEIAADESSEIPLSPSTASYVCGSWQACEEEHFLRDFYNEGRADFEPFVLDTPRGRIKIEHQFGTAAAANEAGFHLYFNHENYSIFTKKPDPNEPHHTIFAVTIAAEATPFAVTVAAEATPPAGPTRIVATLDADNIDVELPAGVKQEFIAYAAESLWEGMLEGGLSRVMDLSCDFAQACADDKRRFCGQIMGGGALQNESVNAYLLRLAESHGISAERSEVNIEMLYDALSGEERCECLTTVWAFMSSADACDNGN